MRRILFVDDEQPILDGLRNLLRKRRGEWDMHFALGAHEALAQLRTQSFDVLVTDMRMPEMDGAALLSQVKNEFPAVARIVLSGYAKPGELVRALPAVQQFLSKPCNPEQLRAVVERTCELERLVGDAAIQRVAGGLDALPSIARTYWRLRHVLEEPHATVGDLADVVETDQAMATKALQLVNSPYFGLAKPVLSIRQAVQYLGSDVLKSLALTAKLFATLEEQPVDGLSLAQLQRRALLSARLCRGILPAGDAQETAFSAALVHDLGEVILAMADRERYTRLLDEHVASGTPLHELERAEYQTTHAEVGAYLLGLWGLPVPICEAVALHHAPQGANSDTTAESIASTLRLADALAHGVYDGLDALSFRAQIEKAYAGHPTILQQLPTWIDLARRLAACSTTED